MKIIGSYALGFVHTLGERAAGPCPALTKQPDNSYTCGIVNRPKDWLIDNPKGVTPIREAMKICIGAGIGCDEAGEEPLSTALSKIDLVVDRMHQRYSRDDLRGAAPILTAHPNKRWH